MSSFARACFLVVCLPALLLVAPVSAWAQDDFRQTVVVTGAATPVTLGTTTRTITVISREQLLRLPVHSVADVLRLAASVDVRERGERGMQADFGVRGANFGQMLVLVDGVRLNDAQSGHHNGDIPVPLDAVARIEILHGAGSSIFGADAFGGTVNIITRDDIAPPELTVEGGSFGLMAARGRAGLARGGVEQILSASFDRSSGFMLERGYAAASIASSTSLGDRTRVSASYLWKDFGANGFYGNAPSHEWTNQTLVALDQQFGVWAGWDVGGDVSYRTHGDHFLFDVRRPGVAENRHRTHAARGTVSASRSIAVNTAVTAGVELGSDWIRSSNLGDHETQRASGFAEWRQAVGDTVQLDAGLRVDRYTEFGTSWSPSAGISWWAAPQVRLRASAGRAFRVPTFTERYYSDPNHLARPGVVAETAWAGESGIDVFLGRGWVANTTVFGRVDSDVIDWLRASSAERWQTYNIRDVDTVGLEVSATRSAANGQFVQASYTALDVNADAVTMLSKYVLDYAPHSVAVGGAFGLPAAFWIAPRVEYRHRTRSTGISDDVLLDLRISRAFGAYELRVDGTNLFDASYQEILGVAMPGAAMSVSISVRGR